MSYRLLWWGMFSNQFHFSDKLIILKPTCFPNSLSCLYFPLICSLYFFCLFFFCTFVFFKNKKIKSLLLLPLVAVCTFPHLRWTGTQQRNSLLCLSCFQSVHPVTLFNNTVSLYSYFVACLAWVYCSFFCWMAVVIKHINNSVTRQLSIFFFNKCQEICP